MQSDPNQNVAAIDIGSNSITLIIASRSILSTGFVTEYKKVVTTGLAATLPTKGVLSTDALRLIFETISEFKEICKKFHIPPTEIKAVATAAARIGFQEAQNFFDSLKSKLNIQVHIITPHAEILLAMRALSLMPLLPSMQIQSQSLSYFDLGGASTEIASRGTPPQIMSIPYGGLVISSLIEKNSFSIADLQTHIYGCVDFVADSTVLCTYGSINLFFQMMGVGPLVSEISQHGCSLNTFAILKFLKQVMQQNYTPHQFLDHYPFIGFRSRSILGAMILFKEFLEIGKPRDVICTDFGVADGLLSYDVNDLEQFTLIEGA
ncbi:MAG: hypothetical protein QE271_07260 [Bacteriovoracaceae bacterium]|nr:hypothetical protein [Bacteriovoracaceae bacterium]